MSKYTCNICKNTFSDEDPFLVQPICPNCKKKQTSASVKISTSKNKNNTFFAIIFYSAIFLIVFLSWGGCKGLFTYHDKIFVKDKLKTYSTEDFAPGAKNKNIDIVRFDTEDKVNTEILIYNKTTGEEKKISLKLPLYQIRTRAEKNDFDTIIRYKQPMLNSGNSYIKTTDAIFENSKEFNSAIDEAKLNYIKENTKEMKDWVFNKEENPK